MKKIIFYILLCLGYQGFGQETTPAKSTKDSTILIVEEKPVYLEKKGYKIQIPKTWRLSEPCLDQNCSLFAPADTLLLPDTYVENINITVEKLSSTSYTVDQYTTFSIGYLPKVVQNFKLISKKKVNGSTYVIEYKGRKNNYEQSWRQFYYVKNAKVFIVTFAAETPKFEYYKPLVEPTLKSFRLQ